MTSRHRYGGLPLLLITSLLAALLLATSAQASTGLTGQVALDFGAVYRYQQVPHGAVAGFEAPSFDDGFWAFGQAGFGTGGCAFASPSRTYWSPFTDILIRHEFTLPAGATDVRVLGSVDNVATVYVNGQQIAPSVRSDSCAINGINMTAPADSYHAGTNVLAVRGFDDGGGTYLDQKVVYDVLADTDDDGIFDPSDNCPNVANADQADQDGDHVGDVCDPDIDGDGVANADDAFPVDPAESADTDGDGVGDNADNCVTVTNSGQADVDGDGVGNACDSSWFGFGGYRPPVNGNGVLNVAKAGSAIPLKFSLGGDKGLAVFEIGYPKVTKRASCDANATDTIEETVAATNSGLQYDALSQSYIYVWKTAKTMTGCYSVRLSSGDNSTVALFQLT